MSSRDRLPTDLPDSPQGPGSCRAGFPWLTFNPELESEFRRSHFDENLSHTRVNLCLAVGHCHCVLRHGIDSPRPRTEPHSQHDPHAADRSDAARRSGLELLRPAPSDLYAAGGDCIDRPRSGSAAVQIIATLGGVSILFPCMMLTVVSSTSWRPHLPSCGGREHDRDVRLSCGGHRAADAGARVRLRCAVDGRGNLFGGVGCLHARENQPHALSGSLPAARHGGARPV